MMWRDNTNIFEIKNLNNLIISDHFAKSYQFENSILNFFLIIVLIKIFGKLMNCMN